MKSSYLKSIVAVAASFTFFLAVRAQDEAPPFPKPGAIMPQSFAPLNLNRIDLDKIYASAADKDQKPDIKARRRCLMCEVGVKPFILVFARKPADNTALVSFMKAMEGAIGRNTDFYLNGAIVFVDAGARSSLQSADEKAPQKLIKEESDRLALRKWLNDSFGGWLDDKLNKDKKVYVAIYPEPGPAKFKLDPATEVTVFFARKHRLIAHWQYAPGMFNDAAAKEIITLVEKKLAESAK